MGGNLIGVVIQVGGSSWAKKMIILRLKSGGMGLFNNFVHKYYHLVAGVSLYVEWDFVMY